MFQLHVSIYVSIYVSIISIDTKGIILFHNYKLVSRIGFTRSSINLLGRIIIGLASLVAVYIYQSKSPLDRIIKSSIISKQTKRQTHTLQRSISFASSAKSLLLLYLLSVNQFIYQLYYQHLILTVSVFLVILTSNVSILV